MTYIYIYISICSYLCVHNMIGGAPVWPGCPWWLRHLGAFSAGQGDPRGLPSPHGAKTVNNSFAFSWYLSFITS